MKAIGLENVWFSFAGRRNGECGVEMLSMPTRPHPARKGKLIDVEGADGKLWLDGGGYDRILVPLRCMATDNANIDAVSAWLSGSGDLVFGDEPERAYHARITKEFSRSNRSQRLRGQEFTVTFDCEPYRYQAAPEGEIVINSAGTKIENPGTVASAPLLRVNCSGAGTLMIGGASMLFEDMNGEITLDCDAKMAFTGAGTTADPYLLATQHVTGEWITIAPGANFVSFTGGITSVRITPRWRWL